MKPFLFSILFQGILLGLFAQNSVAPVQLIKAFRTENTIKIDGSLDEGDWQNAMIATDFVESDPDPGTLSAQKSEVRILYDDKAIYVGAILYDSSPDSILRQLSERDQIGITDWFGVILDPYQDGLNGVGFVVTSAGIQYDTKYSALGGGDSQGIAVLGGDNNWDAVWDSHTQFTAEGWIAELKIPYSAIRFPKTEDQIWNINFGRMIRRTREQSFWNEVKPEISGLLNQSGKINGINNIKSPVRLSATPFVVAYLDNYRDKNLSPKNSWLRSINGGMDIKYGINDAFTLDMTLIPDFGQTQSDNQILNLSPFEIRFDENRQFFTEGTELFNKGGLFYSRRVGGRPVKFFDVYNEIDGSREYVDDNPVESQLFNATKVSGRTNGGLGIGVFNATSGRTFAKVKSFLDGSTREIETNPLTNYNVFVLDQNLKNNSFVTLINTNVWRAGSTYDANVTGTRFALKNKENSYELRGGGALNQKYFSGSDSFSGRDSTGLGHTYDLGFAKTSGNFQYSLGYGVESRHYDPNDLGFLFSPNSREIYGNISYSIFKPFGNFNRFSASIFTYYARLQEPNVFQDFAISPNIFFVTKGFLGFGLNGRIEPVNTFDYFEPRTSDFSRYFTYPTNNLIGGFISTDYRKRVALDGNFTFRKWSSEGRNMIQVGLSPRFRVNDKLFLILNINNTNLFEDVGYVSEHPEVEGYSELSAEEITFSKRDQLILDNVLTTNYIFNNKMSLSFRVRHYWTRLEYNSFHRLDEDGFLQDSPYTGFTAEGVSKHNTSFNIFNIDMVYRWRFAPGSDVYFVWKNSIAKDHPDVSRGYFKNLGDLLDAPQLNSLSIKVIYYLDYLDLKKQ